MTNGPLRLVMLVSVALSACTTIDTIARGATDGLGAVLDARADDMLAAAASHAPLFAIPSGATYTEPMHIALHGSDGQRIHFTLNGMAPTLASPTYEAPIAIAQSTVLKFAALDNTGMWSPPHQEEYSFLPPLRFNEVEQKATHNSFARDEPIFDQIVFDSIRSVELDIHTDKRSFERQPQDWFVYHVDIPGLDHTSCTHLSDCLKEIRTAHNARPEHEVITVFVDLKNEFTDDAHTPADLDAQITSELDSKMIWKPEDAIARCARADSIRDSVSGKCSWPLLSELRGKFIFAVTGGNACRHAGPMDQYAHDEKAAESRVAFVAPDVNAKTCPLAAYNDKPWAAFFNLNYNALAFAPAIYDAGLMSRAYYGGMLGGLDTPDAWQDAIGARVHFLATDRVNEDQDPWATTKTAHGWPFRTFDASVDVSGLSEPGSILAMDVRSGDIDRGSDDFYFLYDKERPGKRTWASFVSTKSSHVEPWAKGCLMARATEDATSPYFAVCRPADHHGARVQYRLAAGDGSAIIEADANGDALDAESTFYLRMSIADESGSAMAVGEGSFDGTTWFTIHKQPFGMTLPYQGIAASAHDKKHRVRFLFGDVTRSENGTSVARDASSFDHAKRIGECPEGIASNFAR